MTSAVSQFHRARELLRRGVTAASVATAVGFCDQSQLHRHFVRLVGVTPGRYAASARSSLRAALTLGFERGSVRDTNQHAGASLTAAVVTP